MTLWRDASNLYLGIIATNDTITVQSWYDDPNYRVEQIAFADGTVWSAATMAVGGAKMNAQGQATTSTAITRCRSVVNAQVKAPIKRTRGV